MPLNQKIFALSLAFVFLLIVIDLARRKKLRVEYSLLWTITAGVIVIVVVWYEGLLKITRFVGAVLPTTILFIFGIMFLLFLNLHFSVKVSDLSEQVKNLGQELSLRTVKKAEKEEK